MDRQIDRKINTQIDRKIGRQVGLEKDRARARQDIDRKIYRQKD